VSGKVTLTPEAKDDIAEAAAWYRERSILAAERFLFAIGFALSRIEQQPTTQAIVDVSTGARRALLSKFPHRVFYLIDGERIVVFAVISHLRDDTAWRERLD
jgi:plasmid stabilization system protein ParE